MSDAAPNLVTQRPPRNRRTKSYWEPIYEPNCNERFIDADWPAVQLHGAATKTLSAEALAECLAQGTVPRFSSISFRNCDFFGYFSQIERVLVFENCDFDFCDFGLSTWKRAKFTNCSFRHSSFTQCTLIECEFRRCSWESMGLSGNETRFEACYFDNPCELVDSRYLNIKVEALKLAKTTRSRQMVRHWDTKATVARQLYHDLKAVGDEKAFYEACRCFVISSAAHGLRAALYPGIDKNGRNRWPSPFKVSTAILEIGCLYTFGWLNRWGASVARPLLMLVGTFILFSLIYTYSSTHDLLSGFSKSFEITSIAGYTRGATSEPSALMRLTEWANLSAAIVCYTVFFATAVAKIARVR